jgi:hypothetical protein
VLNSCSIAWAAFVSLSSYVCVITVITYCLLLLDTTVKVDLQSVLCVHSVRL